jgi:WD40 repeat protein
MRTLNGYTSGINAVTFSPDGRHLVSGAFNGEVRLWDVESGEARGEFDEFEEGSMSNSDENRKLLNLETRL